MLGKWSNEEINKYIDEEGLGYAVLYGVSAKDLEDEKLAVLWEAAEKAFLAIENYMEA